MKKGEKMTQEQKDKISASVKEGHTRPMLGRKMSKEAIEKIRAWHKGKVLSEEHKRKLSEAHKGKKMSEEQRLAMSLARKGKVPINVLRGDFKGEKHPNWKGGITPLTIKIRNSKEYSVWRTLVFKRDNYSCVLCSITGVYLEADHIKRFSEFPALRLEVSNGRTLCKPCHKQITWPQ